MGILDILVTCSWLELKGPIGVPIMVCECKDETIIRTENEKKKISEKRLHCLLMS